MGHEGSPATRGDGPGSTPIGLWRGRGFPRRAGMDRHRTTRRPGKGWFPRPRGDGTRGVESGGENDGGSPAPRGEGWNPSVVHQWSSFTSVPPPARGWTRHS